MEYEGPPRLKVQWESVLRRRLKRGIDRAYPADARPSSQLPDSRRHRRSDHTPDDEDQEPPEDPDAGHDPQQEERREEPPVKRQPVQPAVYPPTPASPAGARQKGSNHRIAHNTGATRP